MLRWSKLSFLVISQAIFLSSLPPFISTWLARTPSVHQQWASPNRLESQSFWTHHFPIAKTTTSQDREHCRVCVMLSDRFYLLVDYRFGTMVIWSIFAHFMLTGFTFIGNYTLQAHWIELPVIVLESAQLTKKRKCDSNRVMVNQ